jgi:uncharacterized membrane protein (DUF4010 family)
VSDERELLLLATALAIGLLIGVERGWHGLQAEKAHIPGLRTFGLIGLLGGVTGLAARHVDTAGFGLGFLAFSAVMATVHVTGLRHSDHPGITSLVAALLTFALGALAALGSVVPAAATAVVASLLLGFKPWFKRALAGLEELELHATLKLLLLTVVLLPILPDRGFGPGDALNPYQIWWMVVMIALISFSGYFAVKAIGGDRGVLLTSVFAGLASSTSLTLHFARLARAGRARPDLLAAGILLAGATLFPRVLVIAAVLQPDLALALAWPMGVMALCLVAPAVFTWLRRERESGAHAVELRNPLELGAALRFGLMLAAVLVLTRYLSDVHGDQGLLVVGAISGLIDLNAITLAVASRAQEGLQAVEVATIVLASASNGVFKGVLALVAGTGALAARVALPMVIAAVAGLSVIWLTGYWPFS